jgi:cystathionine beta-lyase/cystathionine gamma-synthase
MPYTQGLYGKPEDLVKVASAGLNMRQVRISAGLEDIESLLQALRLAQVEADATLIRG